ncbi:MAG TPA: chemotaxis protein CheW [Candidatus Limnocylindria bacterium]|nr:chemotaxis protein CheW [Candidatus Limnocylindria bacterium]
MSQREPDAARAILTARARSLARPTATAPTGEELSVVGFEAGGEAFAIEARYAHEIVRLRHLAPVPGAPAAVCGVTTYRGEILAVVDVRATLGHRAGGLADLLWVIVIGAAMPEFGLLADRITGVEAIGATGLRPLAADASARARRLARATTERAALVLDGATLLADQELFAPRDGAAPATANEQTASRRRV